MTSETLVFAGTYTRGSAGDGSSSEGIYTFRLDEATGALDPVGTARNVTNPSFLALHPSGSFLYAVSEMGGEGSERRGGLAAFRVETNGRLTYLNTESTRGNGPCHVSVDSSGRWALVANYASGSLAVLSIQSDGRLGAAVSFIQNEGSSVHPQRQEGPHAHSIYHVPGSDLVLANDLGLDRVLVFRLDAATGALRPNDSPWVAARPGAGPRHLAIHPSRNHVYVINELDCTVAVYSFDPASGKLIPGQVISTLPAGFTGESYCAEVQLSPDGRFLYGSNRGHDSLAVYNVSGDGAMLTLVGHLSTGGKWPRNFGIDPSGRYLLAANQRSRSIFTFRLSKETGMPVGEPTMTEVPQPVCIKFLVR
ncbi:MAG: lactonase family protein [Chloroflexi bacterium]|nr:lactonase family protein [Chloroflexota bacterium]